MMRTWVWVSSLVLVAVAGCGSDGRDPHPEPPSDSLGGGGAGGLGHAEPELGGAADGGAAGTTEPPGPSGGQAGAENEGESPTFAPELHRSVASNLGLASAFLYTGKSAPQKGVGATAIDALRVAVVRGRVEDEQGQPLAGVQVSVAQHAEYGYTLTRADGLFDLAVNGGAPVTLRFEHEPHLSAQRTLVTRPLRYAWAPDVVLREPEQHTSSVSSGAADAQVARGSVVSDASGERQATLVFRPETAAVAVAADGSEMPLTTLTLRVTDVTAGEVGPRSMPATLPPSSGYTYAVELSVDEAKELRASHVRFDKPVAFYVENFLGFPVGAEVPLGNYDTELGRWDAALSGVVLEVLQTESGRALLDTDGDHLADDEATLSDLGIDEPELQRLAELYAPGQTLWRVELDHFSLWDLNWPFGPPDDAVANALSFDGLSDPDRACRVSGSIIHCESQVLGEKWGVVGTPFELVYGSDRSTARKAAFELDVPITGATVPESLKAVELEVFVAGQRYSRRLEPTPSQVHHFTWDGRDGYGRLLQGSQPAQVRVGYVYDGVYNQGSGFGRPSSVPITGSRTRQEVTLWREEELQLGAWDALGVGLGGLSLSQHHAYDPVGQVLYRGDGTKRSASSVPSTLRPVSDFDFGSTHSIAFAPDGTLYVIGQGGRQLLRVDPQGNTKVVAGNGGLGLAPDGTPALEAQLSLGVGLAVRNDGSVIFEDNRRVRTVSPDGTLLTLAGGGERPAGFAEARFGLPAQQAYFDYANGLAVAPDGSIFIADAVGMLWRLDPGGTIWMVASSFSFYAKQAGAVVADIGLNSGIALAADGSLLLATTSPASLVRLSASGQLETLATESDGLYNPKQLAVAADGSVLIANSFGGTLLRYATGQAVQRLAGAGHRLVHSAGGPVAARDAKFLGGPSGVAVSPRGDVYLAADSAVYRLSPAMPGVSVSDLVLPSDDGSELYVFNGSGRHLSTYDALTGIKLLTFEYDEGRLSSVVDRFGATTLLTRDAEHRLNAITAPDGQRSDVELDATGRLTRFLDPLMRSVTLSYDDAGLLSELVDARGATHQFSYDGSGRLVRDEGPGGFEQRLVRSVGADGYTVSLRTPLGRITDYAVSSPSPGVSERSVKGPDRLARRMQSTDAARVVEEPDGTRTELTLNADARFDLQVPRLAGATRTTPGGRQLVTSSSQAITLDDEADPLSVSATLETKTLAGRTFQTNYERASHTITHTSPEGRISSVELNERGQVARASVPGRARVAFEYDERGRLVSASQGEGDSARSWSYTYDDRGWLSEVKDALDHVTHFQRDAGGRALKLSAAGAGSIDFAYDEHDNLLSLSPPGRSAYRSTFDAAELLIASSEPQLAGVSRGWSFDYTADQELSASVRPDGSEIGFSYDDAGRLVELETSAGPYQLAYAVSGQLASVTTPSGDASSWTFDGPLLLTAKSTGSVNGTLSYAYDSAWQLSSTAVNGRPPIALTYDDDGLLLSAGPAVIAREPLSGATSSVKVDKLGCTYAYNDFGELASQVASFQAQALLEQSYERDALGRVTTLTETIAGQTTSTAYGYDAAGRLTSVERGSSLTAFEYDANGNRLVSDVDGTSVSAEYDAHDRIVSSGARSYEHDALGQLVRVQDGATTTSYSYDDWGHLAQVTLPSGSVVDYVIDGVGRRIGRKLDGVLTAAYLYDGALRPRAQLDVGGAVVAEFVYAGSETVPTAILRGAKTYALVRDHLGSVRLVVDSSSGTIAQRLDYDAFGSVTLDTNPGFQPFGFAGGLYDPDTALVHFGARDYDASIGRWVSKDPIRFRGRQANLYVYAGNDAVNHVDPTGHYWWIIGTAAVTAGADLIWQLSENGGDFGCVSWGEVGVSAFVGAAAGTGLEFLFGTAFSGLATSEGLVAVTQWGGRASPWVMLGGNTARNWLMAGGPQIGPMSSGFTQFVDEARLAYPSGIEAAKGVLGQRILSP